MAVFQRVMASIGNEEAYETLPNMGLNLGEAILPVSDQPHLFPRFDCFLTEDDVDGLEGRGEARSKALPVDLMPDSLFRCGRLHALHFPLSACACGDSHPGLDVLTAPTQTPSAFVQARDGP